LSEKNNHYKELMSRMKSAHEQEFYLEACWFAYTVLEDRLLSALRQSGGATYANHRPIRMLGKKMQEIRQRKRNDPLLAAYFNDPLMDRIHQWKEDRNDLTHAMADGTKSMAEVDKSAYLLSTSGAKLVNEVCSAARRLKKNREKA
tara:strand:- start:22872 stop:23309 length:438 start_codon:yes stop_codon:yes gene_type:complete